MLVVARKTGGKMAKQVKWSIHHRGLRYYKSSEAFRGSSATSRSLSLSLSLSRRSGLQQSGSEVCPATCVFPSSASRRRLSPFACFSSRADGYGEGEEEQPLQGRVVSHRANFVHVRLRPTNDEEGKEEKAFEKNELLCVTRQVLKKMKRQVLVGDFVEVTSVDWTLGHGVVHSVLPRNSIFQTPAVANVELAILMFSLKDPPIEVHQVNRFLVAAEGARLPQGVLVVLNKQDLVPESVTQDWVQRLKTWGYDAIPISANEGIGVSEVCDALEGKLGVIVGPSGVGKSSLINAINTERGGSSSDNKNKTHFVPELLLEKEKEKEKEEETKSAGSAKSVDEDENASVSFIEESEKDQEIELLDVGEVSARTGRGKHTTRNISLIKLSNGGLLADTPGFNQPHLLGVSPRELSKCFPEIVERLEEGGGKCSFKNCAHIHEPGCIVRGEWERYPMYVDMYNQVKLQETQALKTGSQKESREGDVKRKSRQGGKVKAEPRLNKKKHRRTSRKLSKQQFKQAIMEEEFD